MSLYTELSDSTTTTLSPEQLLVNEEFVKKLMHLLDNTSEGCFSCYETYALLDEYAEKIMLDRKEAAALMPLVQNHIEHCPGCRVELEALLNILTTDG